MQQVFVLRLGSLPDRKKHPFRRRLCEKILAATPGYIDLGTTGSGETLLFLGTLAHAIKAKRDMRRKKSPVDEVIYTANADYETHTFHIIGPLEEEDAEDHRDGF